MTVAELIQRLNRLPGEMEVGAWRYHFLPMCEGDAAVSVETRTITRETGERTEDGGWIQETVDEPVAVFGFHR